MPRVIVIEDSATQAQLFALLLEDAGFEVETAPDAECGMELLRAGRFDIVLSDLHLPGDSGFDLCQRIKADPILRRLPVVVYTSEAEPVNVLRGLQCGADGFITKQRDPEEIVRCLRRTLARPPGSRGAPTRVAFLDLEFELTAGREQLLDILVSAFEDVVHLNDRSQASALALRAANRQMEERNLELQRLADSERRAHEARKTAQSKLVEVEKLTALGHLVAGVAHEINNPLAFISNNLVVLQRDVGALEEIVRDYEQADATLAEHQPELLGRIRSRAEEIDLPYLLDNLGRLLIRSAEGVKRIQRTVANLRDFARLDEGDLKDVDLNEGVVSTVNLVRGKADERQVTIAKDLAPLPQVFCYPAKINQVVHALLDNAIDACAAGDRVTVSTRRFGSGVEIEVADTGCGITPAVRAKIFDPFFTTKPQGKGTGLGLSISYGIVQAHGGRIDVESESGQGARFFVRLPLTPMQDGSPSP